MNDSDEFITPPKKLSLEFVSVDSIQCGKFIQLKKDIKIGKY